MNTGVNIDNLLGLARSAELARNNEEAIAYYNRVLEAEPRSPEAWLGKGRAAGWLSSLAHVRVEETIVAGGHAIGSADADEQPIIAQRAAADLTAICAAVYGMADRHRREHAAAPNARSSYVTVACQLSDAVERAKSWDPDHRPAHELAIAIAVDLLNLGAVDAMKPILRERLDGSVAAITAVEPSYLAPELSAATTVQLESAKAESDAVGYVVAFIVLVVGAFIAAATRH